MKKGLGRGLQSFIPTSIVKVKPQMKGDNVYYVEVNKIRPNPNQPRRDFDLAALKELAASIKKHGVLQPILVSKVEQETEKGMDVDYELIAGERRWRAAQLAGLPHIPVIVKDDMDENKLKLEVALVENLQREDLNSMEEAEAYQRLASEFKITQQEIANRVGKSREAVTNTIRLLGLPANIKEALRSGKIMRTHARSLLALKDQVQQQSMFKQILAGKAIVRDIESQTTNKRVNPGPVMAAINSRFRELQDNLAKNLRTVVFIKNSQNGGKIEIKFSNLEELNTIVKTILD